MTDVGLLDPPDEKPYKGSRRLKAIKHADAYIWDLRASTVRRLYKRARDA